LPNTPAQETQVAAETTARQTNAARLVKDRRCLEEALARKIKRAARARSENSGLGSPAGNENKRVQWRGVNNDWAVVVTVTVVVAAVAALSATEAGNTEHFAVAGAPLQARETVPLKPPVGVRVIGYVAV
jgi:hypothetical protein